MHSWIYELTEDDEKNKSEHKALRLFISRSNLNFSESQVKFFNAGYDKITPLIWNHEWRNLDSWK